MDQHRLRIYVGEVGRQAAFASLSMRALESSLARPSLGAALEAFAAAQSILTAGAQISKLMWPELRGSAEQRRFTKQRGSLLRRVLSPDLLLHSRTVRNSVEHFDERMDRVIAVESGTNIIDSCIGPKAMFDVPGAVWIRHLDPTTLVYSARGLDGDEEVELGHLHAAIQAVGARADVWEDAQRRLATFP